MLVTPTPAPGAHPVALYARVSTDRQAEAQTVGSQLAALRERAASDGLPIASALEFVDEGYSGATLVRPALEQLRDLAALGGVEVLYVHSPDRLARKYVFQVLLLDEFVRVGVRVVFLNQAPQQTPEDELLLPVQGVIAEYERAKIMERVRTGRTTAWRSSRCAIWPSSIPPLAGSWQFPLPWGEVALMPLIMTARGSWDLQRPFYAPRTLCHIVCRV